MAFFEHLGKTVNNATQEAVKKTKNATEIAKLNSQISSLKAKAEQNYQALGERYFQLFGDAPVTELAELVDNLKDLTSQISACEKEIQVLMGMIQCPSCGKLLEKDSVFCTSCGLKIIPEDAVICPNCHVVLDKNAAFCNNCGQKIISDESVVCHNCYTVLPKDTTFCTNCGAKIQNQADTSHKAICKNCGAELADNTVFCSNCGTKVDAGG